MNRQRTASADCKPGWYRSMHGRPIQLVKLDPKLTGHTHRGLNGRWTNMPGGPDWLPYRSPGNPKAADACRRVTIYGWVPPSYPLLEAYKPRWA